MLDIPGCIVRRSFPLGLLSLLFVWPSIHSPAIARPSADESEPSATALVDVPETFQPRKSRDWDDQARLEALTLFSAGRAAEHRGQSLLAIRYYERALVFDPEAYDAARAVVPLAFELKRHAEALRHAALAAKNDPDASPPLLRQLATYLVEEKQYELAGDFYCRALRGRDPSAKWTAEEIRMQLDAGQLYYLADRMDRAVDCFSIVLDLMEHPDRRIEVSGPDLEKQFLGDPVLAYSMIADAMLKAGRGDEAERAHARIKWPKEDPSLLLYNKARVLRVQGKLEQSRVAIEQSLEKPGSLLAEEGLVPYEFYSDLLDELGQRSAILDSLEKLRDAQPGRAVVGYALAEHYQTIGRDDAASSLYERLLRETPTLTGYRNLATIYVQQKDEALLGLLGKIFESTGGLDAISDQMTALLQDEETAGRLVEAAQRTLRSQAKLAYGEASSAAILAIRLGKFDDAERLFEAAIRAEPEKTPILLRLWGGSLLMKDAPKRAAVVLARAVAATPKTEQADVYYLLATALTLAKEYQAALDAADQAIKLDPDEPTMQARRAWVLSRARRYEQAREAYHRILVRYDGKQTPNMRLGMREVRLALASLCADLGEDRRAEEWLLSVLEEFPGDVGASNDLGYLWADQVRHLATAERLIRRAVQAEPDNAAYRDSCGWVCYRLGRTGEALEHLDQAVRLSEKEFGRVDGEILEHIGDVHHSAGRLEEARKWWTRSSAAYKEDEVPEDATRVEEKLEQLPESMSSRQTERTH